jgi:hypothetical protein
MADDLFVWLDAIWNKKKPQGAFPARTAHCFLAADPDMAMLARELQLQVREPELMFRIWQGYLPKGAGAPRNRLHYIAAKKPPQEEELITRIKKVLSESRSTVEQMVELVKQVGRMEELYWEYGVEAPKK